MTRRSDDGAARNRAFARARIHALHALARQYPDAYRELYLAECDRVGIDRRDPYTRRPRT